MFVRIYYLPAEVIMMTSALHFLKLTSVFSNANLVASTYFKRDFTTAYAHHYLTIEPL